MSDDPVVQALETIARVLRDWPPEPQPAGEWDPSPYLPGGSRYIPKVTIYGTPVLPTSPIPVKDPGELAAEAREEAAARVLAVLRGNGASREFRAAP